MVMMTYTYTIDLICLIDKIPKFFFKYMLIHVSIASNFAWYKLDKLIKITRNYI